MISNIHFLLRNTLYSILNTRAHRLFFYLLVLFLPTQLGWHFWPEWATVLGRRIDYLSPTLYVTDVLLILTIVCWVWEMRDRIVYTVCSIVYKQKLVFGILLFAIVNIAFSNRFQIALYVWIKVLEYCLLGLYIIKSKPSRYTILNTVYIAVHYSSLIAIGQFILQHSIGGPLWLLGERTFTANTPGIAQIPLRLDFGFWILDFGLKLRGYGTFPHPNVLGGFLAVTLPLLASRILYRVSSITKKNPSDSEDSIWKTIFLVSTAILGVIALGLTFSRSAWVVGGVCMLYSVYSIVYKKKYDKEYTIHNTLYSILTIAVVFSVLYSVFSLLYSSDESVVVRLALNASAIEIWKTHPWFGVGAGNFLVALPSFLPSNLIYFLQPVHNIYLLLLSEVGVIGVIIVLSIVYRVLSINKYTIPNTQYTILICAILLLGLVDHYPLTLQQGQLLIVLCILGRIIE